MMHGLRMSRAWIAAAFFAWIAFAADAPHKANAPDAAATARRGTQLAEDGHCDQALTLLTKSVAHLTDSDLKKTVGFDGIKCAMTMNQMDAAADFVRLLQRDFPKDPQVLYVATHVYSDLSIRASQALLYTAPGSYQVHELNAEALETQGKWDDAAADYHLGVVYQRTARKEDAAREFALRKEISDQNRQLADDVHAGIVGPQEPEP